MRKKKGRERETEKVLNIAEKGRDDNRKWHTSGGKERHNWG